MCEAITYPALDEVPNMDCMDADELWSVWHSLGGTVPHPVRAARRLFPDRPHGYVSATRDLRNYAANKACAVRARLDGRVHIALAYESICDSIYAGLPDYARAW